MLNEYDSNVILSNKDLCFFFDEACKYANNKKNLCNLLTSELQGLLVKNNISISESNVTPKALSTLSNLIDKNTVSSKQAKEILPEMLKGKDPESIIKEKGIEQLSDEGAILKIVNEVLDANQQSIDDFKNGKDRAFGFLVGQIMKKTNGQVNPKMASEILTREINKR